LPAFEAENDLLSCLGREISAAAGEHQVQKAVIYGSVATGVERPDSDVDLLLVVNKRGEWLEELQNRLRERVLKNFGNMLSTVVCTPSEYEKMGGELKKEVEKGIVVVGG
jgi:predicted nucleotidyltransferase